MKKSKYIWKFDTLFWTYSHQRSFAQQNLVEKHNTYWVLELTEQQAKDAPMLLDKVKEETI
jgi:hypothetical protein